MDTPTFNPIDIVKFASTKDAVNVSAAFDQMIGQRVYDAIQARKQEIAGQMFNDEEEADDAEVTDDNSGEEQSAEATAEDEGSEAGTEQTNINQAEESDETAEQNT